MTIRWWRPPDAPLRRGVALAAGSGLAGTFAVALGVGRWLGTGPRPVVAATAVFAAAMLVAAGAAGARHPFARFGFANVVTTLRLMLVAVIAGLVMEPGSVRAAWLVVATTGVVAALDGVDGWLARRGGMASAFGARFDMETDALFILVLSALVWSFGRAGAWVLACGLMRYAFVAAGWVLPWMSRPLTPTLRGKTVAVLQFLGLAAALAPPVRPPLSAAVAGVTLATLAWSFAVDVGRLWRAAEPE
ncbi:MAG: CDP-alcohol phosphatidyltransferase family protein [Acidobacteriota bacterium]|nr:CDP-alcohol phosphatidyltransferase family protein [Acidobacteriota bacterium]